MLQILIVMVSLVGSFAYASCAKGCTEYVKGICSCEVNIELPPPVEPSDEKPPRHPQPAYERGEVTAAMPPNLIVQDMNSDKEMNSAILEGKKAAGIK